MSAAAAAEAANGAGHRGGSPDMLAAALYYANLDLPVAWGYPPQGETCTCEKGSECPNPGEGSVRPHATACG
jgi:hypothetical protein